MSLNLNEFKIFLEGELGSLKFYEDKSYGKTQLFFENDGFFLNFGIDKNNFYVGLFEIKTKGDGIGTRIVLLIKAFLKKLNFKKIIALSTTDIRAINFWVKKLNFKYSENKKLCFLNL